AAHGAFAARAGASDRFGRRLRCGGGRDLPCQPPVHRAKAGEGGFMNRFLIGAAVALSGMALGAAEPRLSFSKSFPGSAPAYVAITLEQNGAGEYKEAPDDDSPLKFQLSAAEAVEMFALADKLDRFKRPLESPLKVAQMGMKT